MTLWPVKSHVLGVYQQPEAITPSATDKPPNRLVARLSLVIGTRLTPEWTLPFSFWYVPLSACVAHGEGSDLRGDNRSPLLFPSHLGPPRSQLLTSADG